jgi:hypothetical protein
MATFIDEREEDIELQEDEQVESLTETPEEEQPQEPVETEESVEEKLPEKYQGKTVTDIIAMHQNAEQLLGKQGQEVGELRRIVDDFINSQSVKQQETAPTALEDFDETEFFEKPKETIQKLLDNHPSIKQSQELAKSIQQQEALARLKTSHPDYLDVIKDEKFGEWVTKSKIRTKMLQEADKNYDFDSADELLTLWKERQQMVQDTVNVETQARKESVKAASSGTSKGSAERAPRKVYRRADIIELMRTDPDRYASLAADIRQAYAEGRVK